MPHTYTLTRFYKEAEKLIIKHKRTDPDFRLRVSFYIEPHISIEPTLDCTISYSRVSRSDEDYDFGQVDVFMGYGATPQLALAKFKIRLTEPVYVFLLVGVDVGLSVDEAFED